MLMRPTPLARITCNNLKQRLVTCPQGISIYVNPIQVCSFAIQDS
jgi:hypothetical protein